MSGLKLMTYGGYVPRVAPHLLQDNEAQKAVNTKLYSGDLQSWKKPGSLTPQIFVPDNTATIFRGKTTTGATRWIGWTADVDVARSPVAGSEQMNIFYTGDGAPKKTNSTLCGNSAGQSPDNYYMMGVPAPLTAPTVAHSGTGSNPETRIYVYTYVNNYGGITEESAPSPVSAEVVCGSGDTVTVSGFAVTPTSHLNITKRRIYRSVTGTNATEFQFVGEINISVNTFTDNIASASLGETLQTLEWLPPPDAMRGVIALPNGYLAGFFGQTLCFSEVSAPHAWPIKYQVNVGYDIVGIAAFGQSIAVMTKGYPYIASGVSPESVSVEKVALLEPCVAKRSITSDSTGVTYASPNGLVVLGPGEAGLITGNVMLRDDFQKFAPANLRSAFFAGKYFGFFNGGTGNVEDGAFILDRNLQATPLSETTLNSDACFVDPEDGNMYVVSQGEIKAWEGDAYNKLPFEWISKRFVFTAPANLGAIEIDGDFDSLKETEDLQRRIEEIIAANQALFAGTPDLLGAVNATPLNVFDINGSLLQNIPDVIDNRYLLVDLYCDDKLIHSRQYTDRGVFRLPAGFKGQTFVVRIAGNIELRYIKMAETIKELKSL